MTSLYYNQERLLKDPKQNISCINPLINSMDKIKDTDTVGLVIFICV